MSFLSAALTGLSALAGHEQNRKAQKQVDEGNRLQSDQAAKEREIYQMLLSAIQDAEGAGVFSPETQIAQLDKDRALFEGTDRANTAGAMRIAGFRPGDSEIGNRQDAIGIKYQADRDRQATDIRQRLPMARIQAYAGLRSPQTAQIGGDIANQGRSRMTDLTGLFSSIQPYLATKPTQGLSPVAKFGAKQLGRSVGRAFSW